MTQPINQAGTFRGVITSYALQEAKSSALAVEVHARIDEAWIDGEWQDWREYECESVGYLWIIKKDGTDNDGQITALVEHAGWDGSLPSIVSGQWQPTPCQFVVTEEAPNEYHTESRYRVAWLNGYDQTPSGGNVDASRAAELQAKYGPRFRALAGNARRNAPKPDGKPAAPPAPASKGMTREEVTAAAEAATAEDGSDIPF